MHIWFVIEVLQLIVSQETHAHQRDEDDVNFSALDEDDFQTILVENKLGCDIYLKKIEQNSDAVEVLHDDGSTSVWLPPPRFTDRLNVVDKNKEARYYVAVNIVEAKVITISCFHLKQLSFCYEP